MTRRILTVAALTLTAATIAAIADWWLYRAQHDLFTCEDLEDWYL